MKSFLKERSYEMVRMFLNQFATAMFGFVLALAAGKAKSPVLRNLTSVGAIIFYLFLLYTMTWELGFKEKSAVDSGRKQANPWTGALISLCANSLNFLIAILITLASWVQNSFFGAIGGVAASIGVLIEGMFTGLLANQVGGVALNSVWWIWFLLPIPSIATCGVAYWLGLKDKKFTGFFNVAYPESDREPKKRR